MTILLKRRAVLRGAAGAALPLPFLNLMRASASSSDEPGTQMRFLTLFKPNGVHPPSWNISGGKEYDFRMSPLMKPFVKHREDLLILDNMGDFGFSSHANSTRRFLSGHHQNTRNASIDQLIADKVGKGTPHRSLELTTEGLFPNQIGCSYISYNSEGAPIPRESDPQLVFDRLFRNPLSQPSQRAAMKSLLDSVAEDARSLNRRAGSEDRETIEQYLTVVRETEKRLQAMQTRRQTADFSRFVRPERPQNLNAQVESMIDLIALALWTDSSRCITYMLGNSNSRMIFDFLGVQKQHHYLSHFFRNFSRENLDSLLKISLWHMEKFDYLLTRLKSFKEHQGTLLDNTLVMFGSGMGHSDNHTVTRIPLVLAGGKGFIRTVRYVRYSENQPLCRLHLSLLSKFGVKQRDYAQNSTQLAGLESSDFSPWKEPHFDSWIKTDGNSVSVRGRLRMSDDLNEAKLFYIDVDGQESVLLEIDFGDFHRFNVAYHCGTAVTLKGKRAVGENRITKIESLESLFGHAPGDAPG